MLTEKWLGELGPDLERGYAGTGPCHDLGHAVRVALLAERIAHAEGVDEEAAVLAALLHDVGHAAADNAHTDDHEERSSGAATALLRGRVSDSALASITDAVAGRRFAKLGLSRQPVGAVLDDADNLDAIGYTGAARAFLWLGEHGRPVDAAAGTHAKLPALAGADAAALRRHWSAKLAHLAAAMRTPTGTRLAADRAAQLQQFLNCLENEIATLLQDADRAPGSQVWQGSHPPRATGTEMGLAPSAPAPVDPIIEVLGIDGAGKSTVVSTLASRLNITARKVSPYPPEFHAAAERVERVLGEGVATAMRASAVARTLIDEAAQPRNGPQIFDRYVEAARMFFAVRRAQPVPDSLLDELPRPGLIILLDLDPELAMARRLRPSHADPGAEISYLQSCSRYLRQAATTQQWLVIDASQPLDKVLAAASAKVKEYIGPPSP